MAPVADCREGAELASLIDRHMLCPFVWGESDCCIAVCNVLRDAGFTDLATEYRGRYSDETGAREIMHGTVEDVAIRETTRAGWQEINPAEDAQQYDMGVYGNTLAVYDNEWWTLKTLTGVLLKRAVRRAWRPK